MGNRHPASQDIVASNTFSVCCGGNLQNLDKTIIETLVARDHARSYGRFQLGFYAFDDGQGGHGRKELIIRLSPSAQMAPRSSRHQGSVDITPFWGLLLQWPSGSTVSIRGHAFSLSNSSIAGRVRDIVGQLLEFWVGLKAN